MPFQYGNKEYLKRKSLTQEQRNIMSKHNSGENNPCYNRIRPETERRQISLSMKGKKKSPKHISNVIKANMGKKRTREQNEANRQRTILHFADPKNRELARSVALNQWRDPKKRKKCIEKIRENGKNESIKLKISNSVKKLWRDSKYRDKMIKAMIIGNHITPNKPETLY